jgi:uncharacterized YkwD family protein
MFTKRKTTLCILNQEGEVHNMKKNLRALILTLGILVTTGISSAVYAQDCNTTNYKVVYAQDLNTSNCTVQSGDSIQKICAKYGIEVPKGLTAAECLAAKSQVTNTCKVAPTKATPCTTAPCKVAPTKVTPCATAPCKVAPTKATPCTTAPCKVAPTKVTPCATAPCKATPTKVTPAKATPAKATPTKVTPAKVTPAKVTPAKATTAPNLTEINKLENEVVALVNQERAKLGLAPLKQNLKLSNVARYKSEDMRDKKYFSHTSPTYGSPFDMMKQFGIDYMAAGENIAMGQPTAASVMNAWMNSPGHKANILSKDFTEIGVGVAKAQDGTIYWTQQFIGK